MAFATMSVIIVLVLSFCGVATKERDVDDALLKKILKKSAIGLTAEMTKKIHVTKIEMLASSPTKAVHWSAKITTDNTNDKQRILLAEFVDVEEGEKATGEEILAYADTFPEFKKPPHVEVTIPAPGGTLLEKDKAGTPLTLERLLQCIFTNNLKLIKGKCFIYVYRMLHFATGKCACGQCVSGVAKGYDPLAEMKEMLTSDTLFKDNASFKQQMVDETWHH